MKKSLFSKNLIRLKQYLAIVFIGIFIFNLSTLNISAESIFNLMGLVYYSNGTTAVAGDNNSPNSFANARAYRSNIDNNFKNSNKPTEGRIYSASSNDPAYFLFDVGSSAWNPLPQEGDTAIVVLETYQGLNGWNGPSYVAGVKTNITQSHLNSNGLDYSDSNLTLPIQNAVMEQIPTPVFESNTYNSITISWNGLWDNNNGASGASSHNSIVGYSLYKSDNGGAYQFYTSVPQNAGQKITYTDTSVVLGHIYKYKIKVQFEWNAHNPTYYESVGESSVSADMAVKIPVPDKIVFTSSPQTISAGTKSNVITIQTRDEEGNDTAVLSDTTIELTSNSSGANKRFYSAIDGVCTNTVITTVQILTGSSSSQFCYYDEKTPLNVWTLTAHKITPSEDNWDDGIQDIAVESAALNSFQLNLTSPQNNKVGFTGSNTLTAYDIYGNIKKNFNASENNITFSVNPANGVLSGLSGAAGNQLINSNDFVDGIANLTGKLTYSGTSGEHIFTASTGSINAQSNPVLINSAETTHFSINMPSSVNAGQQFNITSITALDEFGNVDTNYNGVRVVEYSGPADSPLGSTPVYTTAVNFTNGVSTTVLSTILVKAETTKLNITINGLEGESDTFTVNPATATNLNVQAPNSATAGISFNIASITAYDQFGNVDTNYSGLKNLIYSGPSNGPLTGSPIYTTEANFNNGSAASLPTILVKKETVALTVTDSVISGTSDLINVASGEVSTLEYVSGNNQTARINTFLPQPLVVQVKDAYGNPKNNYPVDFVITKGNGFLSISTPITDAEGQATQNFRLGSVADTNSDQVQAQINGAIGSPVIFDATATPNDAANLIVTAPSNVTAGNEFNLTMTVVDEEGNIITDFNGEKVVSYAGAANSPDLTTPTYTTTVNFTNGLATSIPTILVKAENLTITATLVENNLVGTSDSITVVAGVTKNFVIEAPQTVQSGISFNLISIRTIDDFGNYTTQYSGTKTLVYTGPGVDPVSTNSPEYTIEVEFTNGEAVTTLATTLYKAETVSIKVSDSSIEGTSNPITVTYNAEFIIYYVSGNNQNGIIGQALEEPLKVVVLDNQGNPALDKQVIFTVTNGGGSVAENIVNQETGEVATIWTLGSQVGNQSVTATVEGVSTTITFNATAVADSATIIDIAPLNVSAYAGYATSEIKICLHDQFGNQVLTNVNREMNLQSSSNSGQLALLPTGPWNVTSVTIPIGESCASIYYKDSTAGTHTFTVSSNSLTSAVITINILSLVPTTIIVAPTSFTIKDTSTQQLSAVVYDQFNQSMTNTNIVWEMNDAAAGTITQSGLYYPSATAGTYNNAIKVSYSGLAAYSTPTITKEATNPQPNPQPQPVVPQPQLQPVTPTVPVVIPTEEVTIIVDPDYYTDDEEEVDNEEVPIVVEIPAISILSPKQGTLILSNGAVSISGLSKPEEIVIIKDSDNNVLGSVTSDKNGYWKLFVGRNKFNSNKGTITASVYNSNITTLPISFDFRPLTFWEYLMDLLSDK